MGKIASVVEGAPELGERLARLGGFSRRIRASEYHLTNACNIRCRGCWFFEYGFERRTHEETSLQEWQRFATEQAAAGVTAALIIGGEPTLHPDRVAAFTEVMEYVTISTNGLRAFPAADFPNVAVALTLFGGGPLDDSLRGIRPNGKEFTGLFAEMLRNYKDDPRATFIYALSPNGVDYIEDTVRRIADNGNQLSFNYYIPYGSEGTVSPSEERALLDEALRVKDRYPDAVVCEPYYIETLILGATEFGTFGYEVCPSISSAHPAHAERLQNGHPVLPGFNAWAPDLRTVNFCCTSGHCDSCRDSQAVFSWLLTSLSHFLGSRQELETWVGVAESYWRQFVWSPYHRSAV
jgi:MoaA/NifB/PqqE/SkfB family radical SAM enzyme